jgi:hypothetical protein
MKQRNPNNVSWFVRRRIIVGTLLFCAVTVGYITLYGTDTRLNETIIECSFLLAGSVIGSYVFGAIWDDKNIMSTVSKSKPSDTTDESK